MADPSSYAYFERDAEQSLVALKKGTQLIKYSRKGKPKFRAFRLSPDETTLIWISHGAEKTLKLSSVTRIIPGQRTPVFRRYLRPEKDYLSFSLIYNNGERSLDLICKDKVEAEVWLAGLKALIGRNRGRRSKSEISDLTDAGDLFQSGRPYGANLESTSSIARGKVLLDFSCRDTSPNPRCSDVGSEHSNMQLRTSRGDGFRISVSSTPSCSSGGSGLDDIESLGDVYVWGESWNDAVSPDGSLGSILIKNDVLSPKSLESNVVLDVHQIACGARHMALVTKQGEVFTWGEESGGRLGHGIEKDFGRPHLVEFLALTNVDCVACGEHHTCAVSTSGDLFTWGDGAQNPGLLGHGTDVSHWIPKQVSGPLEGLQVMSIACGMRHSALTTSDGKLFTFGEGTFGVLGHGDRESVSYPKEVKLLSGLKTIKVACGVWHTAAIVEVITNQSNPNIASRKLFTWGDGDKYHLGHQNADTYLVPTCVSSLIDYNFVQLACGHTMTVGLTTTGNVFTMGSSAHGQLGNPGLNGKVPALVQDKLVGEFVEQISCGAHHVAVLTSRSEIYTWGRGSNGQLGHGDSEDKKVPTLVEALKDRHVKHISCGSNFTSCICLHKWVSGVDQSVCSGCRQAFGFTRKRHNCYHCGLVHCHACSSKKAMRAALAPTPGKPHRVCDACFTKLKSGDTNNNSNVSRKFTASRQSIDNRETTDIPIRSSRFLFSPNIELGKYDDLKWGKPRINTASSSILRASLQAPSLQYTSKSTQPPIPLSATAVTSPSPASSPRPSSPYSRRLSPGRAAAPGFSRSVIDSLRRTNDILLQDMTKMQNQMKSLKQKCDLQEMEIQKLKKQATEDSSKSKRAKELVESITEQLKEIADQLPPDIPESETFKAMSADIDTFLRTTDVSESSLLPVPSLESVHENQPTNMQEQRHEDQTNIAGSTELSTEDVNRLSVSSTNDALTSHHSLINEPMTPEASYTRTTTQQEHTEQFEHGVYVTFIMRPGSVKIFRRVRFSKKRFQEQEAEIWWKENKDRLLKLYRPHMHSSTPPLHSSAFAGTSSTAQSESFSGPPTAEE